MSSIKELNEGSSYLFRSSCRNINKGKCIEVRKTAILIQWENGNRQWIETYRIFPTLPCTTPDYEPIEELGMSTPLPR